MDGLGAERTTDTYDCAKFWARTAMQAQQYQSEALSKKVSKELASAVAA